MGFPTNRPFVSGPFNKDKSIVGSILGRRNFWETTTLSYHVMGI